MGTPPLNAVALKTPLVIKNRKTLRVSFPVCTEYIRMAASPQAFHHKVGDKHGF